MIDHPKRTDDTTGDVDEPAIDAGASDPDESSEDAPENAIGAYLLDALPENERAAFESFLASSPEARAELLELAPVVALLPNLLNLDPTVSETAAATDAALRDRILDAVRPAAAPAPARPTPRAPVESEGATRARTIRTAPDVSGPFGPNRARGRIRSGVDTSPRTTASPTTIASLSRLPASWLMMAAIGLVAIGAIIWALALQGRIDTKNREITAQSAEIAELRRNANATAYTLTPGNETVEAGGTLFFSLPDQIGVLSVHGLPKLDENRVYQLWYLNDGSDAAVPGGTFTVDRNGNGLVMVSPDTPIYDGIAITEEPKGGSQAPTSAILLQGRLSGAAG